MRLATVVSLALCGRSWAYDCKALPWLDQTFVYEVQEPSPPTLTHYSIYFNPCSPVNAFTTCASDDHLCVVEMVSQGSEDEPVLSAVKSYGSASNGAVETVKIEDNAIRFNYQGARWGSAVLQSSITMICGKDEHNSVSIGVNSVDVDATSETVCRLEKVPRPGDGEDDGEDDEEDGGWGFFTWLFVLVLLAVVAYVALTVYINFAQSRGTLPLAADIGDVLRDLPYLIRDVIRRIKQSFSTRSSTSGYAAL